jgi:hypothetical protein
LNQVQRGYSRDNDVLEMVDSWRVIDSHLVANTMFRFPTGLRKCQERLFKLFKADKIERWKNRGAYVYGTKTPQWQHTLLLNYVRAYLEAQTKSWEKVWSFTYEFNTPILRTDALMAVKNTVTGQLSFSFVEMERASNDRNRFDKVAKYNKLFEAVNDGSADFWWVPLTKRFPPIIIVPQTETRMKQVEVAIKEHNTHGLEFQVMLFEDLRREVVCVDMDGGRCKHIQAGGAGISRSLPDGSIGGGVALDPDCQGG